MTCEVFRVKPLKQKISITLDEDIIKKINILSEECDRSLSQYINLVLKEYLASQENYQKNTDDLSHRFTLK